MYHTTVANHLAPRSRQNVFEKSGVLPDRRGYMATIYVRLGQTTRANATFQCTVHVHLILKCVGKQIVRDFHGPKVVMIATRKITKIRTVSRNSIGPSLGTN